MEPVINIWATLVAAVISMGLGALWYSPILFGNLWMKTQGITAEDMEEMSKGMVGAYLLMFIGAVVMSFVLGHMVDYTGSNSIVTGVTTGFWLWLGFVAPVTLQSKIFEDKPCTLWLLNNAYNLAGLCLMGAVLAVWV